MCQMVGHVAKRGRLDEQGPVQTPFNGPPSLEFRSIFLHVIARTNVDVLTSAAPTNVNADDRASCTPSRDYGEFLTEAGLTRPVLQFHAIKNSCHLRFVRGLAAPLVRHVPCASSTLIRTRELGGWHARDGPARR